MKQYIIFLILEIMMIATMLQCLNIIDKNKIVINTKNIILCFIACNLLVLNNIYMISELKLLISIVVNISIVTFMQRTKLKECIINTLLYFISDYIIELLIVIIFALISPNIIKNLNSVYTYKIVLCIIVCVLIILLYNNKKFKELIMKISKTIVSKLSFNKMAFCIILILNLLTIFLSKNIGNLNIIILSISTILFIIISSYEIITDKYNIIMLKKLNKNLNSYINAYSETIDSCREFKHNLKNDLFALKSTLSKKEQDSINKIIKKYNKNYEWISNLSEIPDGLQGLIYIKQKEAKENNIDIFCNIKNKIKIKEQDYFMITEIIGILLDNSIDASIKADSKNIVINIDEKNNEMIINIINKFKDAVDLNKITEKKYSTKLKKSGIGLNYINKIKKNNISVEYHIINDLFYATVKYIKKQK